MSVDAENSAPSRRSPTQQAISSAEQIQFPGELAFGQGRQRHDRMPWLFFKQLNPPFDDHKHFAAARPSLEERHSCVESLHFSIPFKAFNHLLREHLRRRRGRIDPNNFGGVTRSSLTRYFSILSHLRVLSQLPRPYIQLVLVHKVLTDIDRLLQGAQASRSYVHCVSYSLRT